MLRVSTIPCQRPALPPDTAPIADSALGGWSKRAMIAPCSSSIRSEALFLWSTIQWCVLKRECKGPILWLPGRAPDLTWDTDDDWTKALLYDWLNLPRR